MTWNLENLFSPDASSSVNQAAFEQKLDSLAQVILELDPDILGFQEVGGLEPLNALIAKLEGRYPHAQMSVNPDRRGIRVGFLSKLMIEASEEIHQFPAGGLPSVPGINSQGNLVNVTQASRGALRILVKPKPDLAVHLITAHLKSKLLTFPSRSGRPRFSTTNEDERAQIAGIALLQRTAESVALRVKANEVLGNHPNDALVVLGDLNDVTDAATTQILQGPPGSEIGTNGFDRPDQGDKARLFNLAPLISLERRFSRIFKGNKELIDHILVSEELLPGQPRQRPQADSHVDAISSLPSINENPDERRGNPGSDHAPITALFEV